LDSGITRSSPSGRRCLNISQFRPLLGPPFLEGADFLRTGLAHLPRIQILQVSQPQGTFFFLQNTTCSDVSGGRFKIVVVSREGGIG
jgi:hypothetical protein